MNTTGLNWLFKSKGYTVQSAKGQAGVFTVSLRRDKRFKNTCPACFSDKVAVHKTVWLTAQDSPFGNHHKVFLRYQAPQIFCRGCGGYRTIHPSLVNQRRRITQRYMEYASRLCRKSPVSEVAEILEHSASSIREWDKGILENTLQAPDLDNLRVLLVDEKSVRKGHKYVTVVMDGDSREVIYMEEGAKKETLMGFYDRLKPAQKGRIQAVGLDRGGAYLSATREALPKADIVFDKFHLIQNLNAAMDEVRREEYREALRKKHPSASLIKGQRYNLLRLPENRTAAQSLRLGELLNANETLSKAHLLSEQLRILWTYGDRGDAEQFLQNWIKMVEESGLKPLIRYAKGLWLIFDSEVLQQIY